MGCQDMKIKLNKDKNIGKVLFIVEGSKTEFYLLSKIFNKVFDYQYETIKRALPYEKYNAKINPLSRVFVINTENSNIKSIDKDNKFLDKLFEELIINYDFSIDNAAIYYIFDRDHQSNNDVRFIENMLGLLKNSRDNEGFERQGLLLLSYPSLESFIFSNFVNDSFDNCIENGNKLKEYLNNLNINQSKINEKTLMFSVNELIKSLRKMDIFSYDLDDFGNTNKEVFIKQEEFFKLNNEYRILSLLSIALLDLGLITIEE